METASLRTGDRAEPKRSDNLIFDFGINSCEDTDFYLKKGFRVVGIEANPAACRDAERRYAKEIATGQLTVLNRAISQSSAPLTFYLCTTQPAHSTASSNLRGFWSARGENFEEIEVTGVTASELIACYGVPYYAKIDIEGFDLLCVQAFGGYAEKPRYLSAEIDFYRSDELINRLEDMGYRRFALVGQCTVPKQTPPLNVREGRYVNYEFTVGCSGLFGKELPVEWADRRGTEQRIRRVIWQYRWLGMLARFAKIGAPRAIVDAAGRQLPLALDWYDLHAELTADGPSDRGSRRARSSAADHFSNGTT
jgi:FkbM family methyltransferase